jgi:hypothetical protein
MPRYFNTAGPCLAEKRTLSHLQTGLWPHDAHFPHRVTFVMMYSTL